jgi:hypothetical protein
MKKELPLKVFVASRTGGNARGRGSDRSVVLATYDNKNWTQYRKFWGKNHAQDAKKFVEEFEQGKGIAENPVR